MSSLFSPVHRGGCTFIYVLHTSGVPIDINAHGYALLFINMHHSSEIESTSNDSSCPLFNNTISCAARCYTNPSPPLYAHRGAAHVHRRLTRWSKLMNSCSSTVQREGTMTMGSAPPQMRQTWTPLQPGTTLHGRPETRCRSRKTPCCRSIDTALSSRCCHEHVLVVWGNALARCSGMR